MNEPFNIVTSFGIINEIKFGSKYFKVNLGFASTVESKGGDRTLSDKDQFSYFYNNQYRTTIYAQGNVGNIRFYTDHYIKEDVMAIYYNFEEFIVPYDRSLVKEKGVDSMIGLVLKTAKEEYQHRQDEIERKKEEELKNKRSGDATLVSINPGSVTYEDLKAYMENKRGSRLGN